MAVKFPVILVTSDLMPMAAVSALKIKVLSSICTAEKSLETRPKNGNDVALYGDGRMCLSGAPILGDIYLVQLNSGGIDVGEGGLAENTTYQINFAGMESSSMVCAASVR